MKANVQLTALKAAKGGVSICEHELKEAIRSLKQKYQDAGAGWRDAQYQKLGGIISECCDALNQPISELNKCQESLETLIGAVNDYDNTDL